MQHTVFVQFSAVFLNDYNVKLPETSELPVLWRKCRRTCQLFTFFLTAVHFHLALVATSISYFLTAATKLSCCSSHKKSVSLAWCLLSLFLCPSIFQICGYAINLSLILQTTWIQKQFPLSFSSLLTLLLSVLYKTWVAMRFPAKITSSCIWVAIPVD